MQVLDHRIQVEALEFLCVIKRFAHRIGQNRVLVENLKVDLLRPPVTVRVCAVLARERALAFTCHFSSRCSAIWRSHLNPAPGIGRSLQPAVVPRRQYKCRHPRDMGCRRWASIIRIVTNWSADGAGPDDDGDPSDFAPGRRQRPTRSSPKSAAFSDQHDRCHALDRRRKTPVLGQQEAMLLGTKPSKPPVREPAGRDDPIVAGRAQPSTDAARDLVAREPTVRDPIIFSRSFFFGEPIICHACSW